MGYDARKAGYKGISPLIAAVLLIAITMAIAGLMATFATNISSERLLEAQQCSPALTMLDLSFSNGNITTRIANNNKNIAMQNIRISTIYADATKNQDGIPLDTYVTGKTTLNPLERVSVVIQTGDTTRPQKLEVVSETCPQIVIVGNF